MTAMFAPGDLVYARGREWVALPSSDDETLCLRPLSGAEADVQVIHPALEREPVRSARFALPTGDQTATQDGASCPRRYAFRFGRGAGPSAWQRSLASNHAPISRATPDGYASPWCGCRRRRWHRQAIEAGLILRELDRPRRGRPFLGSLSAPSRRAVDRRA
jgi:hypothetical protein